MYPDEISPEGEFDSYISLFKVLIFIRKHLKLIAIVMACILLAVFYAYKFIQRALVVPLTTSDSFEMSPPANAPTITVDVSGAVSNPGVFELPEDSRIADAMRVAGPITNDVSMVWVSQIINFAQPLQDGQKIYIPFEHDLANESLHEVLILLKETYQSSGSAKIPAKNLVDSAGAIASGLINVNNASSSELTELPGVGDAYADKIIVNRPYKNIEELIAKTKMSAKTVDKFRDLIIF